MRILLSAFACDPFFGSDEEVGWQWACELQRQGHEVWVLTRESHQAAIEQEVARTGAGMAVHFEYVDAPLLHRLLTKVNRRNHIYYYAWQWLAYRRAHSLVRSHVFDVVHHVTWVSFRQPSFMGNLGLPFIFGPVAGGDEIPAGYSRRFSPKQRVVEAVRGVLNRVVRFDPLMRRTYRQASRVYFTSPAHLQRVPRFVRTRAQIELAIAATGDLEPTHLHGQGNRLLFAGRAISLKGMDIGLAAFAIALDRRPGLRLTIVGDGPERRRWQALAERLGVASAVDWCGWLHKAEVQAIYAGHDVLLYPSLRDSGAFVVLEALQAGLPVVCLRLGGPGVMVDASVGAAVEARPDQRATTEEFAQQLLDVLDRAATEPGLAHACRERARRYTWQALVERVYAQGVPPLSRKND